MNNKELRKIVLDERSKTTLSDIPGSFYEDVAEYMSMIASSDDVDVREYVNAKIFYDEILSKRVYKIINKAFHNYITRHTETTMTASTLIEDELFADITASLEKFRAKLLFDRGGK